MGGDVLVTSITELCKGKSLVWRLGLLQAKNVGHCGLAPFQNVFEPRMYAVDVPRGNAHYRGAAGGRAFMSKRNISTSLLGRASILMLRPWPRNILCPT